MRYPRGVYLDETGEPIDERPDPLPPGASAEAFCAWMRAEAAWRDRVDGVAASAFDRAFRKAVRAKR